MPSQFYAIALVLCTPVHGASEMVPHAILGKTAETKRRTHSAGRLMRTMATDKADASGRTIESDGSIVDASATDTFHETATHAMRMKATDCPECPQPMIAGAKELCLLFSEAEASLGQRIQEDFNGWSSRDMEKGFERAGLHVPNLFRVPYEIKRAPGKGFGAFSTSNIEKGTRVYGGTAAEIAQTYAAVPRSESVVNTTLCWVAGSFSEEVAQYFQMYMERNTYGTDFAFNFELGEDRYMNDDDEPTLDETTTPDASDWLVANRLIKVGDEFTVNYAAEEYGDHWLLLARSTVMDAHRGAATSFCESGSM